MPAAISTKKVPRRLKIIPVIAAGEVLAANNVIAQSG